LYFTRDASDRCVGYSDADFAGNPDTRRSTTGTIFTMFGAAVNWRTRLQKLVTLSTFEAELVALCETAKEALWMTELLENLDIKLEGPVTIYEDNAAALAVATSGRRQARNKWMDLRYFWIHEQIARGVFDIKKIHTSEMLADIFTKPLARETFLYLRSRIGVKEVDPACGSPHSRVGGV
jgi:hypothetical protein